MAPMIKLCSFAIAISLALLSSSFGHAQNFGDFRSFCQKTRQANICIQAIDSFNPKANLKPDATGWLQILKFRTVTFALTTRTKLGDALRANPNPDLGGRLNTCLNSFNAAIQILDNLDFQGLTHGNYVEYNRQLGFTLLDVEGCEIAFNEPTPITNPVGILTLSTDDSIQLVLEGLNIFQCNKITACQ